MKGIYKRLKGDQRGGTLILTLVLLVVGGLLLAPLLGHVGSGHIAGQVHEKRMDELYAADAGVEHALWMIPTIHNNPDDFFPYVYTQLLAVNNNSVQVTIDRDSGNTVGCHKVYTYTVRSTTIDPDSSTTVDAVVASRELHLPDLAGSAITSGGGVVIQAQGTQLGEVWGDIVLDGTLAPERYQPIDGEVRYETLAWPDEDDLLDLRDFYWQDVKHVQAYGSGNLNMRDHPQIGPLFRDGALAIYRLHGDTYLDVRDTIYIAGDTLIGQTNHDFTLRLNGNTIFVDSDSVGNGNEALKVGGKVTIQGPGAFVAIGDIYFGPDAQLGGEDNPVLVFSAAGTVRLQPLGSFHGSIVGRNHVSVLPNNTIIYPGGGFGQINFPGFREGKEIYSIDSWVITTHVLKQET